MERKNVYKVIDSERDHQEKRHEDHNNPHHDKDHSVADWLIYMKEHIQRAEKHLYMLDRTSAMDEVRKVTALGVACMENNFTHLRKSG